MTARRGALVALAGVVLAALTGCPAPVERAAPEPVPTAGGPSPRPALETEATTDLPAYGGPPAGVASAGPLTTLRAAVDLTPATATVFAEPGDAAATADGRVLVLLRPADLSGPRLATVAPVRGGWAVTGAVRLAQFTRVTELHVLPDGRAAVVGEVAPVADGRGGYGVAVVDPATGQGRSTVVVPADDDVPSFARSALSADGGTLFVYTTPSGREGFPDQLVAVDLASGEVSARHALTDEVAQVSVAPAAFEVAGLVARPGGGVTLVFDASPDASRLERIPTLLPFDAGLAPDGPPVRLTHLDEGAETQAVTAAADGTVFVVVEVRDDVWVLAVPDGGGAGPVLAVLPDRTHDYALVVEPAQEWALLPALEGARAVDLRTGEVREPLDVGCAAGVHVRDLVATPTGAALIGECGPPGQRTAMLWLAAP
ncbi:hypothetical protein ACI8AF_05870 [Blastococcus sp. SYSU D00669]